jgi:hypothetical protein
MYVSHTTTLVEVLVVFLVSKQLSSGTAVRGCKRLVEFSEYEGGRLLRLVCHDFGELTSDCEAVTVNVKIVIVIADYE